MNAKVEQLRGWIAPLALLAGLIGVAYVSHYRLGLAEHDIEKVEKKVEEIEDEVDLLKLQQLRQLGEVKSEVGEVKGDVKLILRLMQEDRDR